MHIPFDNTLSNLNTAAKYAKGERRWSRYGRNGETYKCSAWKEARRAFNKAFRKAEKDFCKAAQFRTAAVGREAIPTIGGTAHFGELDGVPHGERAPLVPSIQWRWS